MIIAVTSQNFRTVTAHAGKARRFLVYDVQPGAQPVEIDRIDLPKEMSFHAFHEDAPHPVQTAGVERLVTGGCGEGFRGRMARLGIGLVVSEETDPLEAVRKAFTTTLPALDTLAGTAGQHHHHDHGGCGCGDH